MAFKRSAVRFRLAPPVDLIFSLLTVLNIAAQSGMERVISPLMILAGSCLPSVGKYANIAIMRIVNWLKPALKELNSFPQAVQERMKFALQIAAVGQMSDIAKPMKGLEGVSTK